MSAGMHDPASQQLAHRIIARKLLWLLPALLLAMVSSFRNRPLSQELAIFGEVGLAGEVRPVPNGEERLREAAKHGYTRAIVPAGNAPRKPVKGLDVVAVSRLSRVLDEL